MSRIFMVFELDPRTHERKNANAFVSREIAEEFAEKHYADTSTKIEIVEILFFTRDKY